MKKEKLVTLIKERKSFLCVGLDPDMSKIPAHLHGEEDPIFTFNKAIIDATRDYCVAYKPNMAFYECHGLAGWKALEKTINYIGESHFIIADAKRGDIGNTATMYAKAFFEAMPSDSITVAPYMGADSVTPFLAFEDKWAIVLALTSNKGADDFQFSQFDEGAEHLYEQVVRKSSAWGTDENMMYVVGATRPEFIESIREIVPNHFFLVPGVGAQGGDLRAVADSGLNSEVGLLVNSSRGILYAGKGEDFAQKSAEAAKAIALEMSQILDEKSVF